MEKKKLNMFDIFSLGTGGAIGSGIFVLLGMAIAVTGRSIVLVVTVGCLYMLLAYWYNMIMSSMFKLPGGDYDQKMMLFPPVLTGIAGLFKFIDGFAISMYPLAIVHYASRVFPGIEGYTKIIAVTITVVFFALSIRGSKAVAIVNDVMTFILLGSIAIFCIFGLTKVQGGYFQLNPVEGFFKGEPFFFGGFGGFLLAISLMGWACQGTTMSPVSMAQVTIRPRRTIPIAIIFICIAVACVYGLMSVVAAGVLPREQVVGANLADTARIIFPYWLFCLFAIGGGVFAIATSLLSGLAMLRYPIEKVADDGWLPAVFKKKTAGGYPYVAMGVFFVFTILPIVTGFGLEVLVNLAMLPNMLLCTFLNLRLIWVVKKYPEQWKQSVLHVPFPLHICICIVASCCSFIVAYNLFSTLKPLDMLWIAGLLVIAVVLASLRLKTGAVKKEDILGRQQEIAKTALAVTIADEE